MGQREGMTSSADKERIKALERENRELRRINKTLRKASTCFAQAKRRPPLQAMQAFIDDHRHIATSPGVEAICKALPIALPTYYAHTRSKADPTPRSQRDKTDEALSPRYSACGTSTTRSAACARSGASCDENDSKSRVAQCND